MKTQLMIVIAVVVGLATQAEAGETRAAWALSLDEVFVLETRHHNSSEDPAKSRLIKILAKATFPNRCWQPVAIVTEGPVLTPERISYRLYGLENGDRICTQLYDPHQAEYVVDEFHLPAEANPPRVEVNGRVADYLVVE